MVPEAVRCSVLAPGPATLRLTCAHGSTQPFSGRLRFSWKRWRAAERVTMAIGRPCEEEIPFDTLTSPVETLGGETSPKVSRSA